MKVKKFINRVKDFLGLDDFKKANKKKSVKNLLNKLKTRRKRLSKVLKKQQQKKRRKEIQEELDIVSLQIKKGRMILKKLNS